MISQKEIIDKIDEKTLLDLIQQSFSVNWLSVLEAKELASAMLLEEKLIKIPSIKSDQPLKVYLTHDIDWIYPHHIYSIFKTLLFRKDWIDFPQFFQPNIFIKNIEKLIAFEESRNVKSVFLLGANNSAFSFGRYNIRYTTHNPFYIKLIELLKQNKIEIGLHSQRSFKSNLRLLDYARSDKFDMKKQTVTLRKISGEKVKFHRSHFYNFDPLKLWNELDRNNIEIDFSIGNAREVGFKSCIPRHYQAIDFVNSKVLNTIVVPTILSDNAFFYQEYDSVFQQFKNTLRTAKQYGASVAILFHPENMVVKPELWKYYEEIIHICKAEGAVFN